MELFEPWPEGYTINARSGWGPRVHPITRVKRTHHGVDVALPTGTPLTAPADGVVVHKNKTASAGYNLIIRHQDNWHTVYYHLQKPSPLAMHAEVKAGELIGWSGNTGASTGPHLHMELRHSRTWGDSTDPAPHFIGKYKAPEPEPVVIPDPEPEPVVIPEPEPEPEPAPVEPVERPTNQPKPRPELVTPKQRPTNQGKRLSRAEIMRIANSPASGSPVTDGPPRPLWRPPMRPMEKLRSLFTVKRRPR